MPLSPDRYLKIFGLIIGTFVISVLSLNYFADPFGVYHEGKSWDWIHSRPYLNSFISMHKTYAVSKAKADILFLGDSRIYNGLDPHFPALPANTYNLATPGSRVYENLRYLEHATAAHRPTTVVMGIDLRFFDPSSAVTSDFSEDRLSVKADGTPTLLPGREDWAATLFSATALKCSIGTLLAPRTPVITYDRGYDATWGQMQDHFDLTQKVLFVNSVAMQNWKPEPYLDAQGHSASMDAFKEMVRFCANRQIRLIVFVLPMHAITLDFQTSDWDNYFSWMHCVLEVMETEPHLHGEFWDFAGYNKVTTEAFTQPPELFSHTVYYWEFSHFKKPTGDLVLARIFGQDKSSFGRRVTLATLSEDEMRLKVEKKNWHSHGQTTPISGNVSPATTAPVFR